MQRLTASFTTHGYQDLGKVKIEAGYVGRPVITIRLKSLVQAAGVPTLRKVHTLLQVAKRLHEHEHSAMQDALWLCVYLSRP